MADDDAPSAEELEARKRSSAQDAAGDLTRMGIDPALLGLQPPSAPAAGSVPRPPAPGRPGPAGVSAASSPPVPPPDGASPTPQHGVAGSTGRVLPLRPEFAEPQPTAGPRGAPSQGATEPAAGRLGWPGGPVEDLLARTTTTKPVPAGSGRWLRALTLGLLTPDAAEAAGNERFLVAAVRTRQSDRRVVALHAGKGGVGTTTVALGVGSALAAVRDDATVLLDVRSGTPSLAALHGHQVAPNGRDLTQAGSLLEPAALPGGLRVVDSCGWGTPLRRAEVPPLLDRLRRDFTFTLVDIGNDPGEAASAALARSDSSVIVTGAGRWGLAAAQAAATRLRDVDGFAIQRAVYVVVCSADESYRRVHREVMEQLARGPARVIVVPPDPVLRVGSTFDASQVSPATREAMLEVAAALAVSGGVY